MQKFAEENKRNEFAGALPLQESRLLGLDELFNLLNFTTPEHFKSLSANAGVSATNINNKNNMFVAKYSDWEYSKKEGENTHNITDQYITIYPNAVTLSSVLSEPRDYLKNKSDPKLKEFVTKFLNSVKGQYGKLSDGLSFAIRVPIETPGGKGLNDEIKDELKRQIMLNPNISKGSVPFISIDVKTFPVSFIEFAKNLDERYDKFGSRKTADSWTQLRDDIIIYGRTETNQKLDKNFIEQLNDATTFAEFKTALSTTQDGKKREGNIYFFAKHHSISSIDEQMKKYRTAEASDICQLKILESGEVTYSSKLDINFLPALYEKANGTKATLILPDGREMQCHFRYDKTGRRKEPYLVDAFDKIVNTNTLLEGAPVGSTLTIKDEAGVVLLKRIKVGETIQIIEPEKIGKNLRITDKVSACPVTDYSYSLLNLIGGAISSITRVNEKFTKEKIGGGSLVKNKEDNHEVFFAGYTDDLGKHHPGFIEECQNWIDGKGEKPEKLKYNSLIFISDGAVTDKSEEGKVITSDTGETLRNLLITLKEKEGIELNVEFIMIAPVQYTHDSPLINGTLYGKKQFIALASNVAGIKEIDKDKLSNLQPLDVKYASNGQIRVTWIISPDATYKRKPRFLGDTQGSIEETATSLKDKETYKGALNQTLEQEYYGALERSVRL